MRLIYCITNTVNGKVYVGQTKGLAKRRRQHLFDAPQQCDHPMARAVRKYGPDSFAFHVIEECDDSAADERERFWIAERKANNSEFGYNCESGGNACKALSDETKKKIGNSRRKWWASLTQEEKDAYRAALRGPRNFTEEQRRRASEVRKGVPKTGEHRAKIAAAHRNRVCREGCQCGKCVKRPSKQRALTDEQAMLIQTTCDGKARTVKALAAKFNVSPTTVYRYWRHSHDTTSSTS